MAEFTPSEQPQKSDLVDLIPPVPPKGSGSLKKKVLIAVGVVFGILFILWIIGTIVGPPSDRNRKESADRQETTAGPTQSAESANKPAEIPINPNEPFSFRGNTLGMSLADFKAKNTGESVTLDGGTRLGNMTLLQPTTLTTPICTDDKPGLEFPGVPLARGEAACLTFWPKDHLLRAGRQDLRVEDFDGKVNDTEGLDKPVRIFYVFRKNKLVKISMGFFDGAGTDEYPSDLYKSLFASLAKLYGEPSPPRTIKDESALWSRGKQQIVIKRGTDNPHNPHATFTISYKDER